MDLHVHVSCPLQIFTCVVFCKKMSFSMKNPLLTKLFCSSGRHSSLMASVLVLRASAPSSSPGLGIVLCSWARHSTLTVSLSTQEYKRVLGNCWGDLINCGEVTCDGLASQPGGVEILLAASCYKNQDKLWQLWARWLQGFTFLSAQDCWIFAWFLILHVYSINAILVHKRVHQKKILPWSYPAILTSSAWSIT